MSDTITFATTYVFSPSTLLFYLVELRDAYTAAGNWPDDVVEVADDVHTQFVGVAQAGKQIGQHNGAPVWIDLPTPAAPTIAQQAQIALANPAVNVVCASDATLNGKYGADADTRGNITGIAVGINGGLGLPSGADTFNYHDAGGGSHPSWTATKFLIFARGVMVYVYNLTQVASGNGTTLPSAIINIP